MFSFQLPGVSLPTGNRMIFNYFVDLQTGAFLPWDELVPSTESLIRKGLFKPLPPYTLQASLSLKCYWSGWLSSDSFWCVLHPRSEHVLWLWIVAFRRSPGRHWRYQQNETRPHMQCWYCSLLLSNDLASAQQTTSSSDRWCSLISLTLLLFIMALLFIRLIWIHWH